MYWRPLDRRLVTTLLLGKAHESLHHWTLAIICAHSESGTWNHTVTWHTWIQISRNVKPGRRWMWHTRPASCHNISWWDSLVVLCACGTQRDGADVAEFSLVSLVSFGTFKSNSAMGCRLQGNRHTLFSDVTAGVFQWLSRTCLNSF